MRCFFLSCLFGICASQDISAPARHVLYNRAVYPPTWQMAGRANRNQRVHFIVAVKQQNLEALEEKFWAISDPKSKSWRNFMTVDEINGLVGAKAKDLKAVDAWLRAGLSKDAHVEASADAFEVRCSVQDVERLLETEIFIFSHENGHTILRSMGAHSVPVSIKEAIDFIEGIADFPMHRSPARKIAKPLANTPGSHEKAKQSGTTPLVAPETLLEMYSVPKDYTLSKVTQGPAEFQDDTSYNKEDLKSFFKQTDLADETVTDIVGPYDGSQPDTEATLDVQYITSIGQKQVNWYWTSENWMYQWSHTFFNNAKVPDAVSISWGWAEDQQCTAGIGQAECQTLGIDSQTYVKRVNTEFQKIGLRGVSLFVASGDSGANGRSDGMCTDKVLHASFPGSSPYVTAVGATQLEDPKFNLANPPPACSAMGAGFKCASGGTEVAVSVQNAGFTSGGGFSTYSDQPAYQKKAVAAYLAEEQNLPPASYFNRSHRGYPDVAAMGNNFLIYMKVQGGWAPVGGTSAATPTFAGVSAYLNDLSYKKTGKPLGFLNPLLYQIHAELPAAFTDVTKGNNICTEDGCAPTCKGYQAAKGWDPVTGLGTPNADKLIEYVTKLLDGKQQITVV